MIDAQTFVKTFKNPEKTNPFQFGKVNPSYTSGAVFVIYDKDIIDGKLTKVSYLSSYTPTANDRVLIAEGVILGKVNN